MIRHVIAVRVRLAIVTSILTGAVCAYGEWLPWAGTHVGRRQTCACHQAARSSHVKLQRHELIYIVRREFTLDMNSLELCYGLPEGDSCLSKLSTIPQKLTKEYKISKALFCSLNAFAGLDEPD